jgi:hypothetical protein
VFIVWRGRGLLAVVATFLPLASCAGLIEWNPLVSLLSVGLTLAGGGLVCRHYGRKWNREVTNHSLYEIPLQVWGWIYVVAGATFSLLAVVGLVKVAIVG